MDKNAIKKFAVWARTELIARVSLKGVEYGITEDKIEDANADSVGGKVLTADEKKQRQALIAEINDKGYKQVMEEVAYTWFNRFSALRFMEVNGYLPSHVRVFTDEENSFKPQIITEAIHLDLDGLDVEKVYELKDAEKTEELYKYLLIVQCNALNKILPGMFQRLSDYTELLLPDNLLREGSVIQQMIELIPEDDWKDAVQIIGWLYQYYNSEKKDDVFAALKKNMKITILFLALIALGFSVKAQRMALADNKTHGTTAASASTPIPAKTPQFVFTNYGIDLNHADLKEYPQHFLGDRIARKLYATQKVYVRRHTATVGFTDNTMEIYKPAIYNSVMKLDSYFKKAVRRQEINEQTATAELSKCLDAAFVAYYEEETGELEKALKKAKSPEEILTVFNSILIKE